MSNWKDLLEESNKLNHGMIEFHKINWEEVFKIYESYPKLDKVYEMPDLSIWNDGWEIIIMNKEEIIKYAAELGFHLDYDKWDGISQGTSNTDKWMRFCLPKELDERDLRWIWYKDDTFVNNQNRGLNILQRAKKKKEILDFLKY